LHTDLMKQTVFHDLHQLYDHIETFLNTYKHYRPVSSVSHFSY